MQKPFNLRHFRIVSLRPKRRSLRIAVQLILGGVLLAVCVSLTGFVFGQAGTLLSILTEAAPQEQVKLYDLQTAPPYTVALDAGHGGMDTGAQSLMDELILCDKTVGFLFALLEADPNYQPVRTRPESEDRSITERAEAAIAARASLLLSVHANYDGARQSHGFECFPTPPGRLYSAESFHFAECLTAGMGKAGHRLRGENGIRFAYYNGKSKRIFESSDTRVRQQKSFGIVERIGCPAVLAEQCFISNYADVETWGSDAGCQRAARIYYEAICAYFGTEPVPAA